MEFLYLSEQKRKHEKDFFDPDRITIAHFLGV